jgi:hypothetical protein
VFWSIYEGKILQFCFREVKFDSLAFNTSVMMLDCCYVIASCSVSLVAS